jgi:hypothetical protein
MVFQQQLAFGRIAETQIAAWLLRRGWAILPAYDIEYDSGKGPQLFTSASEFVTPDLLVIRGEQVKWVEAKHKEVFTWYRKKQRWETGIDAHHFKDYLRVAELTPWPVYLFFLHRNSRPHPRDLRYGCPERCPVGLFAREITELEPLARFDSRHGNYGMVYWGVNDLGGKPLATLEEVYACDRAA